MAQPVSHTQTRFSPATPSGVVSDGKGVRALSSFGEATTIPGEKQQAAGKNVDPNAFFSSQRRKMLICRERYGKSTQHDNKKYDFNGGYIESGPWWYGQQYISGSLPSMYVPLRHRRPWAPVRIGRLINSRFTSLMFGEGRMPKFRIGSDPIAEDYIDALVKASKLGVTMIKARNIGGRVGSVGLSWRFVDGNPCVYAHNGRNLEIIKWEDEDNSIPSHVIEMYEVDGEEYNPVTKKMMPTILVARRDWTLNVDYSYKSLPLNSKKFEWVVDHEDEHQSGECRFAWIENLSCDDDADYDGVPDYEGLYEQMDMLDVLNSVVIKGAALNMDPTLKLRMDQEDVGSGVKKGSENAIVTGKDGDASYLELVGSSLQIGINLINKETESILEAAHCQFPDPNKVAAAGTSGVALRLLYGPSLDVVDIMRENYGAGMVRVLVQMLQHSKKISSLITTEVDANGNEVEVKQVLNLPPKIVEEFVIDPVTGQSTGEVSVKTEPRNPGTGEIIELDWPTHFKPTSAERSAEVAFLSLAAGGKALLSQQSATKYLARSLDEDPIREWGRVVTEEQKKLESQQGMFPPTGMEDDLESEEEPESEITPPTA